MVETEGEDFVSLNTEHQLPSDWERMLRISCGSEINWFTEGEGKVHLTAARSRRCFILIEEGDLRSAAEQMKDSWVELEAFAQMQDKHWRDVEEGLGYTPESDDPRHDPRHRRMRSDEPSP